MSNDFSRVFAMLRPVGRGYDESAGFVRIELRPGKGRITASMQGIPARERDGVHVVLVGGLDGSRVFDFGQATFDKRGQGGVLYEFTPENLGGAPFAQYHTVAVVKDEADGSKIMLAGVFGKQAAKTWEPMLERVYALWRPTVKPEKPVRTEPDTIIYPPEPEEEPEHASNPEPGAEAVPYPESLTDESVAELEDPDDISSKNEDVAWQGHAFTVKPLFDRYEACEPFKDAINMRFVRVPMPARTPGATHYLLGAHEKDGEIDALMTGFPGNYRITPPPGLEGSVWMESEDGGYWTTWADAYTGAPIRFSW